MAALGTPAPESPSEHGFGAPSSTVCSVFYPDNCNGVEDEEDGETYRVNIPEEVAGSFLWGAADNTRGREPLSFDDVRQGFSDTCSFSAALSAVARTNFDLASGIRLTQDLGNNQYVFQVRMFSDDMGTPRFVDVPFDESLDPDDLKSNDATEFWPALYLRAYLTFSDAVDRQYRSKSESLQAITGLGDTRLEINGFVTEARQMRDALRAGSPVLAGTRDSADNILEREYGLVQNHAYTVMGVEFGDGTPNDIFVTLRNPWSQDTDPNFFDADDDGFLNAAEAAAYRKGIDGFNDGIVRVPWSVFSAEFTEVAISDLTGPNINENQEANRELIFDQPDIGPFTIGTGEELALSFNATDPAGGYPLYAMNFESPGYVHPQSGEFRWRPKFEQAGEWVVTVEAETTPFGVGSITFTVNVEPQSPTVESITSSEATIQSNGQDEITLTANGVTPVADLAVDIEFWRDADGDGTFSRRDDIFLGSDGADEGKFEWTGFVGGLSVGNQAFFAAPVSRTFDDTIYGDDASVDVLITQSVLADPEAIPVSAPLVFPFFRPEGEILHERQFAQGGHLVIWRPFNQSTTQFAFHDSAGFQIPGSQRQLFSRGTFKDIAFLDDGKFAITYYDSGLYGQWFSSNGTALGNAVGYDDFFHDNSFDSKWDIAVAEFDGEMYAVVAALSGNFFSEDLHSFTFTRSTSGNTPTRITKPLRQISEGTNAGHRDPSVTMTELGFGVIVWTDVSTNDRKIRGREFGGYGVQPLDPEFFVADVNSTGQRIAVDMNRNREFVVSFTDSESPPDGKSEEVSARFFRRTANPGDRVGEDAPFDVNTFSGNRQIVRDVAINNAGWSAILWSSQGQDEGDETFETGVYAQLYDPKGQPAGPEFRVHTTTEGIQSARSIEINEDADLFIRWIDGNVNRFPFLRIYQTNVPPELDPRNSLSVPENSPAGTVVGTVAATDLDEDSVTFAIVGQSPFAIDAQSGELTVVDSNALDTESNASLQVSIQLSDDSSFNPKTNLQTLTIDITPADEAPIAQDITFTLPELSENGFVVGSIPVFDPDSGESITFTLDGDSPFEIVRETGELFVSNQVALDFESQASYSLTVRVLDNSNQQAVANVTINLTDVDESTVSVAPTLAGLPASVFYVDGQSASLLFPNVSVEDPDDNGYADGRFRVENAGFPWDDDQILIQPLNGVSVVDDGVRINEVEIGQITQDGVGRNPLQIALNENASATLLTRLARAIAFETPDQDRPSDNRTFRLTLSDAEGNTASVTSNASVNNPSDQPGGILQIIGTPGDDVFNLESFDEMDGPVDGMLGDDVLRITGDGQTLDLTTLDDSKLTGLEALDIRGSGANQLIVSLQEILNLSSTTDTVKVQYDDDDSVDLGTDWMVDTPLLVNGSFVHVLNQGNGTIHLANSAPFSNPYLDLDSNFDGQVSVLDALVIINRLGRGASGSSSGQITLTEPSTNSELADFFYYDSNGDDMVSALDALVVINRLAIESAEAESTILSQHSPLMNMAREPGNDRSSAQPFESDGELYSIEMQRKPLALIELPGQARPSNQELTIDSIMRDYEADLLQELIQNRALQSTLQETLSGI